MYEELVDNVYGYLTIVSVNRSKNGKYTCMCKCVCGKEIRVGLSQILKYERKSCGCKNSVNKSVLDLVGVRSERLIVVSQADGKYLNYNDSLWNCICDCGNKMILPTRSIIGNKKTKSCGCYKREKDIAKIIKFGSDNVSWKGGVTKLQESIKNLSEYKTWRGSVFERDNYTCFLCKKQGKLQAHHIKFLSHILKENNIDSVDKALACKPIWDINNGVTLCCNCHKNVHKCKEYKFVWKPWGVEWWLTNNQHYAYKKIYIRSGYRTSLQYHEHKVETNCLLSGTAKLWLDDSKGNLQCVIITKDDFVSVYPYQKHRIEAITDIVLLEASSPHLDDVIRVSDDANRPNGKIDSEHYNSWGQNKIVEPTLKTVHIS